MSGGCSTSSREGFAIYLTKENTPPAQMPALSHVDIAAQPVISLNDITTYDAETHEMWLTTDAFDRISSLDVPVRGKSFVVCIDRNPIYWGAFWTPISSISFDGVTIWKPLGPQDTKVIRLDLGYPSSHFYEGEDPRSSTQVLESLQQAGKLTPVGPATMGKLPHSMKGYELYSWSEDGGWRFTLITGTNRNKTLEEVTQDVDTISRDGWVHICMVGADAIKAVLSRLPQDEHVMWLGRLWTEQAPEKGVTITLPTGPIVEELREHASQYGLDLAIVPPDS